LNSLKYLIIIFISIIFIGILSFYIAKHEDTNKEENKSTMNKQIIKSNSKEFIYTKEIKLNDNLIELKYYGEELNNKKNITIEVYLNKTFGGEYNYLNNIEEDLEYKKILDKYNSLDNEAYIIDDYIVVNLSRISDKYLRTLILFNKEYEKIDEYNIKNINGYENVYVYSDDLYIYEDNSGTINKYKIGILNDSFNKELILEGSVSNEE
jgi:hypothetical protein